MKLRYALLLCALAHCALIIATATAEKQESKYNEIIKLLSDSTEQLKPAAQSYSASVADPNEYSSSSYGGRGSSERSRYAPSSSSSSGSNKKAAEDDEDKKTEEDEEDKKPDRLALLLAESKFACDGLKNGYYADESVGCQVFHYCVDGVKHSWQCPENTVFHQIHLNCVPNTQDICRDSSKFHVVNDYLHKELTERGPNNTVLYHQRFYPEGFDVSGGDTVTQIFQAQAAAALQKAREREAGNAGGDRDSSDYEEEQPQPRPRPRAQHHHHKPSSSYTPQSVRPQSQPLPRQPVYKQPASRPISSYQPQPQPTKRPIAYSTPEAFTPPSYTESSNDDYNSNSNDFSPSPSSSSSSSSGSSSSSSSPSFSSGPSFNSGSSSSFSPSSSSSSSNGFSGHSSSHHSHQPSSSFRTGSSSSRPNYPTRSLGVPIASFRVAPSSSSSSVYSPVSAQASTIREVNVPLDLPIAFTANQQQPLHGYYF